MKKLIVFLLTITLVFTSVGVYAKTPAAVRQIQNNYTADYDFSLTFENSDDLVALLNEISIPEEINNFINIKLVLESLFTAKSKMHLELDMSDDFKKVDMALTSSSSQAVDFNRNLNMNINTRSGMWFKLDLDNDVFEVVYSQPYAEKYFKFDLMQLLSKEEKEELMPVLNTIFSKETLEPMSNKLTDIMLKYADVKVKSSGCTIKFDNAGFVNMIEELIPATLEEIEDVLQPIQDETALEFDMPSLDGLQLLGKKGITYTYTIRGGNVVRCVENMDISLNIKNIYTLLTGEEWIYSSDGVINLKCDSDMNISKIGVTKPSFPELTSDNSIDFAQMVKENQYEMEGEYPEDYEYEDYASFYASGWSENLVEENGRYYFPLRALLEDAYFESAVIDYENGRISISCKHFDFLDTVTLNAGENYAYIGTQPFDIGEVKLIDSSVYVSREFFENCLNWQLDYFDRSLLDGSISYGFYTNVE